MGKSYRDMYKINELAQELTQELAKFRDHVHGEIDYLGKDYIGQEVAMEMERWGESDPVTIDISDEVIHDINNKIENWVKEKHPELETIDKLIPLLKKIV